MTISKNNHKTVFVYLTLKGKLKRNTSSNQLNVISRSFSYLHFFYQGNGRWLVDMGEEERRNASTCYSRDEFRLVKQVPKQDPRVWDKHAYRCFYVSFPRLARKRSHVVDKQATSQCCRRGHAFHGLRTDHKLSMSRDNGGKRRRGNRKRGQFG